MPHAKLAHVSYRDSEREIYVSGYADILVYDEISHMLVAARFGGYPEAVRALADAINSGGSIDVETEEDSFRLYTTPKIYEKQLKKDAVYTECFIKRKDDQNTKAAGDSESSPGRRQQYIFTGRDDLDQLYGEIDRKTSVPMIPEFREYILEELQKRDCLKRLKIYSTIEEFDAWCLILDEEDKTLAKIVEDGLENGSISIPGATSRNKGSFKEIDGVMDYLEAFGVLIAEKIKSSFKPLYDPSEENVSSKILEADNYLFANKRIRLYSAQKAVAEGTKRKLDQGRMAMIIAECGAGKTKIGSVALHAHQKGKCFNVVLCPSHLTHKWVREIEETIPGARGRILHSISDAEAAFKEFRAENYTIYAIVSKERARDGYSKKPAVYYNRIKKGFICPCCYEKVMMELTDDGTKYLVDADQFFFRKETAQNHKCPKCGALLWTCVNPNDRRISSNQWVKLGEYGYVYRSRIDEHIQAAGDDEIKKSLLEIRDNPDVFFPILGAYCRAALSTFIRKKLKKVDAVILDELHQYKGETAQGNAMAELVQVAKKTIGMTATLINGYASGIFYILYRLLPYLMLKDGKEFGNSRPFNVEYGVMESTYELKESEYNLNSRSKKTKKRERLLPGVSPIVFTRFLMDNAVFLSLSDMTDGLPDYEEIPVPLSMKDEVSAEYRNIENVLKRLLRSDKKLARKLLSKYLDVLSIYPDMPYGHPPLYDPEDGSVLMQPKDTAEPEELHAKDTKVLEIVREKVAKRGRVLIYTNWVKTDTQEKLKKVLKEHGYRAEILSVSVSPDKREEWVAKRVENGIDCLITNPSLVETGLDLNDFTTIIYYNVGYNLFTFRQSSRRSWRINQKAPKVEVYILFYKGTMQHRAIKLMATKLAVATTLEGNISDEGLSAMSECSDMTTLLAKELALGIESKVDDIAEVYRKMAILRKQDMELPQEEAAELDTAIDSHPLLSLADNASESSEDRSSPTLIFTVQASKSKKKSKTIAGQMELFDLLFSA